MDEFQPQLAGPRDQDVVLDHLGLEAELLPQIPEIHRKPIVLLGACMMRSSGEVVVVLAHLRAIRHSGHDPFCGALALGVLSAEPHQIRALLSVCGARENDGQQAKSSEGESHCVGSRERITDKMPCGVSPD